MSRKPDGDSPGSDRILELPSSGLLWPWLLISTLCLLYGVYLLAPDSQTPAHAITSAPSATLRTPVLQPTAEQRPGLPCIACVDSEASTFAWAGHALSRRVEQATRGQLKLSFASEGVINGKKYDELGIIHEVQSGHVAMAIVTSSPLSNIDPDYEIFDLPFLFKNADQADRVLLGAVGRNLLGGLEKCDLKGLGTFDLGFRIFTTSVPMPTLADFKSKKIRVMQSSTAIAMVRLLGCEAVPSPVDKIYQMCKEGYIDGADRTYSTFWDFKLYEVQHFITESYHTYPIKVLIANQSWFASLTKNEQKAIIKAVPEVEKEQREHQREEDSKVKKQCLAAGIKIFELPTRERERFRQACQPLYGEYEKLRGRFLLQEVQLSNEPNA